MAPLAPHRNASSPDRERDHALTPALWTLPSASGGDKLIELACIATAESSESCESQNTCKNYGTVTIRLRRLRYDSAAESADITASATIPCNNRADQQRHMFCNMTPSTPDEVGELTHCQTYQQKWDVLSTARCLRSRRKWCHQENAAKNRSPRRHCGVVANRAESATALRPIKNRSAGTRVREHPVLGKQCLMAKPDDHLMITQ